jgi:hypothetical protein
MDVPYVFTVRRPARLERRFVDSRARSAEEEADDLDELLSTLAAEEND